MAQKLIVEGKDAVVLANILRKRGLNPPKGYKSPKKFKAEFVKEAGSVSKVNLALETTLDQTDISNIGIIVDANQVGVQRRLDSLIDVITEKTGKALPSYQSYSETGFSWQVLPDLKIGIWIMPNNSDTGYLEHFLTELIDPADQTFTFAKAKVDELMATDFCNFTEVKKQKALLHTYLDWQKSPGLPAGTAVDSNFLNARSPAADHFETWFKSVFELETAN